MDDTSSPYPHLSAPRRAGSWRARATQARRGSALLVAVVLLAACSTGGPSIAASPSASGSLGSALNASGGPSASPSSVASATAASTSPSAPAYPLHLVDDQGTAVTIPAEPRRIVSLTPATTETLFALGAGDRVVGRTAFDDYPPEAKQVAAVATYTSVDVEKIVGLGADLVLAGGNHFNDPAAIARLRGLGIAVLVFYAPDVGTVLRDIDLIGEAVGEPARAETMTATMQADIEAVIHATDSLDRPRVFYELDATKDIFGPADSSFLAEMIGYAGGDAITTGSSSVFSIPLEKLVAADPQVIVLGDAAYGTTAAQVKARPGWAGMTAVKTGAIRPVDDTIVTRPGPRLAEGLRALTLAIHPDVTLASPSASPFASPTS